MVCRCQVNWCGQFNKALHTISIGSGEVWNAETLTERFLWKIQFLFNSRKWESYKKIIIIKLCRCSHASTHVPSPTCLFTLKATHPFSLYTSQSFSYMHRPITNSVSAQHTHTETLHPVPHVRRILYSQTKPIKTFSEDQTPFL